MKRRYILLVLVFFIGLAAKAQNDTMYFVKAGSLVYKQSIKAADVDTIKFINADTVAFFKNSVVLKKQSIKATDVDSIVFYKPALLPTSGTFVDDRDSYVYKWVTIGTQIWMAENLKYLPSVNGPSSLSGTVPYYYVSGYDGTSIVDAKATSNFTTYGVLYNWTAAMNQSPSSSTNPSGVQGVCPLGWHLPSDAEMTQMTDYMGGTTVAGAKLKEVGTAHWNSNAGATDEFGFTVLPAGLLYEDGSFYEIGTNAYIWTSTDGYSSNLALYRNFVGAISSVNYGSYNKIEGFSVRCIKD